MSEGRNYKNMTLKIFILLLLQIVSLLAYIHESPIAKQVWQERCDKNTFVLNDCNWCSCNKNRQYTCNARICSEIDKFGHFNDAVRDINVGMQGHGVWRSKDVACEAGVHYRRDSILCVCGEDGSWPNPVCRDVFRVLYPVQITEETVPSSNQECTPLKLHLIGCNACFCPTSGYIDPKLCTQNNCTKDDPIVSGKSNISESDEVIDEVYANCIKDQQYKVGCKTCVCLRNNRLLCGNCTTDDEIAIREKSYCNVAKTGEIFNIDCNLCHCDSKDLISCTAKKCIDGPIKGELKKQLSYIETELEPVQKPIEDEDCLPGTKYNKDCNSCICIEKDGVKVFGCTLNQCSKQVDIHSDCVNDSVYEINCLICQCEEVDGIKRQSCKVNSRCTAKDVVKEIRSNDLESLHGYCEPLHIYKKDCNTCRCLSDGKTITCTSRVCEKKGEPLIVEMLPVVQHNGLCPAGHYYKINCNLCYCLSNGNTICSTAKCKDEN